MYHEQLVRSQQHCRFWNAPAIALRRQCLRRDGQGILKQPIRQIGLLSLDNYSSDAPIMIGSPGAFLILPSRLEMASEGDQNGINV